MKKIGRPIEKENRTKIGLSIDGKSNEILNELVKRTGKTKSRIFEEAIRVIQQREEIIHARMLDYQNNGSDAFLDFDELVKNKKALEKEKMEVSNVG
ncbi:ribbon-helix-helix protein, CopG family [Aliarcobacter lanthieri]|uniref:ribbon-helix-helix protein, CopG family n=1 Tax=Aliarcobacter lanthieri TaxID=1355374 RepID=UPI003AAA3477